MSVHTQFSWSGFVVHFVFGAVLGAALGLGIWIQAPEASTSSSSGFLYIGAAALLLGILAGVAGDRFWRSLGSWLHRW